MQIPLSQINGMPAFSTYYPMPPARYRNVKIQHVYFESSISAIAKMLPECFEPSKTGLCIATGLSVGWSGNYGSFNESALSVSCTIDGVDGFFTPVAYLNSRSSIPAGREIYGTPKVFADVRVEMDERVMVTDTLIAGASAMSIRSTMQSELDPKNLPNGGPSWRLKVIPKADGTGVDVMQLIDGSNVMSDTEVHVCRSGDGIVEFDSVPLFNLAELTPISYYGAYYMEMDFTENYGEIVHDFLSHPDQKINIRS